MEDLKIATMTICSRWRGDASSHEKLEGAIGAIPTEPDRSVGVVKRKGRSCDMVKVPTGLVWRGQEVSVTLRRACYLSTKGSGEATRGNFRNCVQLSSGKFGVKLFRSGAISAYGFKDLDTFHCFARSVLTLLGETAVLVTESTTVALAILDTRLPPGKPLHLRALAQKCASRTIAGETIEFSPEEFAGIKIKLPHPSVADKTVSATIRAKGSVKIYLGTPGPDVMVVAETVKSRLASLM